MAWELAPEKLSVTVTPVTRVLNLVFFNTLVSSFVRVDLAKCEEGEKAREKRQKLASSGDFSLRLSDRDVAVPALQL